MAGLPVNPANPNGMTAARALCAGLPEAPIRTQRPGRVRMADRPAHPPSTRVRP